MTQRVEFFEEDEAPRFSISTASSLHSCDELTQAVETFRKNPHEVYKELQQLPHEALAIFTAQILSLGTAPGKGASASSRRGLASSTSSNSANSPSTSASLHTKNRRSLVSKSATAHTGSSDDSGHDDDPGVEAALLGGLLEDEEEAKEASPPPIRVTIDAPLALEDQGDKFDEMKRNASISVDVRAKSISFAPEARSMSTHEVEAAVRSCPFDVKRVPLCQIYFYQDYVCNQFMDGRFLTATIDDLRSGKHTPETLPLIECLGYRGRYYGMGNRRLSCFHHVFRSTPDRLIPVRFLEVDQNSAFFPQGDGMTVRLGGGLVLDGRVVFCMKHCLVPQ